MLIEQGFSISVVTAFEYEELFRRGRLPSDAPLAEIAADFGAPVVPLPSDAWQFVRDLPRLHRDPLDRMLIAHALSSGAVLATADRDMRRYEVPLAW